jgi:hypothetical protein
MFTAGILALLVEPFFRKEFARDAFLAAFRYVLPPEFREEVEKILRFDFLAEKQLWRVQIEKMSSDVVRVTTSYERVIRNKTKTMKKARAWYEVEDYKFSSGSTEIIVCAVQSDGGEPVHFEAQTARQHDVEAKTGPVTVHPDHSAKVWGKAVQYRRTNDAMYETFRDPILNPEIEVVIDDKEFSHDIAFGTSGDWAKSEFKNHYTFSGVYFPGQFMLVRWWPKEAAKLQA